MSQNTLKVHDLNEDAEFDENGVEVFDEKALVEQEPSDNDLIRDPSTCSSKFLFSRKYRNFEAAPAYRSAVPRVSKHLSERPVSSEAGLFCAQ